MKILQKSSFDSRKEFLKSMYGHDSSLITGHGSSLIIGHDSSMIIGHDSSLIIGHDSCLIIGSSIKFTRMLIRAKIIVVLLLLNTWQTIWTLT